MKPHVICLMASSVDGRTLNSRWRPKGSGGDLFERVHDELAGDAWLVGRVTGQEFAKGKPYPASTSKSFPREPWFARRDVKAYGVVLDARGKIAANATRSAIAVKISSFWVRTIKTNNGRTTARANNAATAKAAMALKRAIPIVGRTE